MDTNIQIVLISSIAAIIGAVGTILIALSKNKSTYKQQQADSVTATQLALNNQANQLTECLRLMLEEERKENLKLREEVVLLREEIRKLHQEINKR